MTKGRWCRQVVTKGRCRCRQVMTKGGAGVGR